MNKKRIEKIGVVHLARNCGLSKSIVSELKNEKRLFKNLRVVTAVKIAGALNCTVEDLYREEIKADEDRNYSC